MEKRNDERISFRIPPDLMEKVERIAHDAGKSVPELIRLYVSKGMKGDLAAHKNDGTKPPRNQNTKDGSEGKSPRSTKLRQR